MPCRELTCKRLSIIALPHKTTCEFYFLALKPSAAARGACVALCCGVQQCVAVCCSVLQRVAVCYSVLQWRSRPPPLCCGGCGSSGSRVSTKPNTHKKAPPPSQHPRHCNTHCNTRCNTHCNTRCNAHCSIHCDTHALYSNCDTGALCSNMGCSASEASEAWED